MTTNNQTKPKLLLQVNLALVLACIPSYLIYTSLPESIQNAFNLWRQELHLSIRLDALLGLTIYWWLPALLVFTLMRLTHFDQWLKVNLLTHLSMLVANLTLLINVVLVVFYNDRMYGLSRLRDDILFPTLWFAAIIGVGNVLWHYVVLPNPKLKAWLTDDILTEQLK